MSSVTSEPSNESWDATKAPILRKFYLFFAICHAVRCDTTTVNDATKLCNRAAIILIHLKFSNGTAATLGQRVFGVQGFLMSINFRET